MRVSRGLRAALLVPTLLAPAVANGSSKAPAPEAFVSGPRLEAQLPPAVVLLDARPFREFLSGHLPGAQSVSPENLRSTSGGVPAALYPPELLDAIFARVGIDAKAHVVVYGAETDVDATYVATAARIAGAARVQVLDGGFARWKAEGRPVTRERVLSPVAKPDRRVDARLLVSGAEARKRVGDGKTVFLDVRPAEQWLAGRIPGATNRFWKADVADGSLRPLPELRAELEAAGVSWERPVVVYCNSGHQASEALWLLREALGHPDARLYQGSWLEWSMTPDAPRESGPPAETR
jgi:thiosulfate/3-mercaptopyruvate sulfurtransferase